MGFDKIRNKKNNKDCKKWQRWVDLQKVDNYAIIEGKHWIQTVTLTGIVCNFNWLRSVTFTQDTVGIQNVHL